MNYSKRVPLGYEIETPSQVLEIFAWGKSFCDEYAVSEVTLSYKFTFNANGLNCETTNKEEFVSETFNAYEFSFRTLSFFIMKELTSIFHFSFNYDGEIYMSSEDKVIMYEFVSKLEKFLEKQGDFNVNTVINNYNAPVIQGNDNVVASDNAQVTQGDNNIVAQDSSPIVTGSENNVATEQSSVNTESLTGETKKANDLKTIFTNILSNSLFSLLLLIITVLIALYESTIGG